MMEYFCFVALLALILSLHIEANKANEGLLRFVVLGDIGGIPVRPYSMWSQRLVSKQIAKIPNVDFFVTTGDNFYYQGVKNVDDFRFRATYERVYNFPSLQKNWYLIAGNHDYYGNVSAQILYTRKSKRWKFPHFYHTKVFSIPKSNKTVQIVMIDTMSLSFPRLAKRKNAPPAKTQMEWIKSTLHDSKADYLIVIGHHPMFSAGWHGSSQLLQDKLQDLFKQHKVNAYISGHDHNLQYIVPKDSSLEHFVCGSSNFFFNWMSYRPRLEPNSLKLFIGDKPGFLVVTAKEDKLKIEMRTTKPKEKYKRILPPRNKLPDFIKQTEYPNGLEDILRTLESDKKN